MGACGGGWATLFGGAAVASLLSAGLLMLGLSRLENDGTDVVTTPAQTGSSIATRQHAAVWLLCSVAVVFWLTAQQQAGSSLAVFAAVNTEPQIALLSHALPLGPGLFASLHGLMVIAMLPIFLYLHGRSQSRAGSTAASWSGAMSLRLLLSL